MNLVNETPRSKLTGYQAAYSLSEGSFDEP